MVIAHSPTKVEPGSLPHRIVIRDLGGEYVVHTEVFEEGKRPWYTHGNYFPRRGDDAGALRKAWLRFEERGRDLLRFPASEDEPLYNGYELIPGHPASPTDPRD